MPDRLEHDFPLFPLGLVALPHEFVPLHIFEDRYRAMFARCLDEGLEFGVLWASDDGVRRTGCAMEITRVLEEMDDGRMNVLTRGTRVFRVVEDSDDRPWPSGIVEFLADKEEERDPATVDAAHEAYAELVHQATDKDPDELDLDELTAYGMAATVDFGLEAKQGLLDLRSENARLRLVTRLFRSATKRLEYIERAEVRAKSNGKVRFG